MALALEEVGRITDAGLVDRLERLVKADRALEVKLLVHLGELDARKLYLGLGYSSMYDYCRNALRMSEGEACFRIRAARVGRRFPLVLERLDAGAVHLSGIKLLAELFTEENHARLLDRAQGKTKKQIEVLVAELKPKPDVPARLRKLPGPRVVAAQSSADGKQPLLAAAPSTQQQLTAATHSSQVSAAAAGVSTVFALQSPPVRASTKPLSPGRFKLEVTLGQEAHDQLEQLQDLLRHQNPRGDLASIIERAVCELLEREMKRRFAQTKASKQRVGAEPGRCAPEAEASKQRIAGDPGSAGTGERRGDVVLAAKPVSRSRYVPREVVREVYVRDAGQCTFVSAEGHRCTARGFLEVHHHSMTFARGGAATADNLRLACRAHNFFLAEQEYGRQWMQRKVQQRSARSGSASTVIASQPSFRGCTPSDASRDGMLFSTSPEIVGAARCRRLLTR